MKPSPDLETLTAAINEASEDLGPAGSQTAIAIYREMSRGMPVHLASVAEATNQRTEEVIDQVARMRGVFTNDEGSVVGFRGLSLSEMPHRFEVEGVKMYTWCALDTLFIPELLNKSALVTTRCPTTGRELSLEVHPGGIQKAEPSEMVMSLLLPKEGFGDNVISSFCHFIHFFASLNDGKAWVENHPETFLLSLDESLKLAHEMNARAYGELL